MSCSTEGGEEGSGWDEQLSEMNGAVNNVTKL